MVQKHEKEAHISAYSKAHPEQSANAIYNHFKGSQYALRKTDTLKVVRESRGKSVSPKKRESSVPRKYRPTAGYAYPVKELPRFRGTRSEKVILERLRDMPNSYAVATVKVDNKDYHIKFRDRRDLKRQSSILKTQYQFKDKDADTVFNGPFAKHGDRFVTPEFLKEARRRGIVLD